MNIRSITDDPNIRSFRLCQTITSSYRSMPDTHSTTSLLTTARRNPPAVMTTAEGDGAPSTILIVPGGLWAKSGEVWEQSDIGQVPTGWALNAYKELGDMSLVAPLTVQMVVDSGWHIGSETINGTEVRRYAVGSAAMIQLLTEHLEKSPTLDDPAPPASYINRYEADFWVDPATGFALRERTIIEYSEERLHGQIVGTGPATFTTTREFYDFNVDIEIYSPVAVDRLDD